ncbi:MAG: hypothetical protein ACR2NB_11510, partial [Solirubrobacteraceae bacterium]
MGGGAVVPYWGHTLHSGAGVSGESRSGRGHRQGIPIRVSRAIAAANRIARAPYVYGGGHASFTASSY